MIRSLTIPDETRGMPLYTTFYATHSELKEGLFYKEYPQDGKINCGMGEERARSGDATAPRLDYVSFRFCLLALRLQKVR